MNEYICPNCFANDIETFFEVKNTPVHNTLLLDSEKEALEFPKGDISLGLCKDCSFIYNTAFDPSVHQYSEKYEETQGFSPTFRAFHKQLAETLIEKHQLHGRKVIEIGCGKGEFLALLCDLGSCDVVGFDPAYVSDRKPSQIKGNMEVVVDFYSEKYQDYKADFVCCKMTLEHIPNTKEFITTVRKSLNQSEQALVFFQVPNMSYVLNEAAFWDIYYEHCSYFTKESLTHLFEDCGFEIKDVWTDYQDQYLMIEAVPSTKMKTSSSHSLEKTKSRINQFLEKDSALVQKWKERLKEIKEKQLKAVIWGGGSKGVAFLSRLGIHDEISYAVDVNPYKDGKYMAGTGQRIVSPSFLAEYKPDIVIIMNPIYHNEIESMLNEMNLYPEIIDL
ncbi:MAG: SAM-dependent methyltransferase [Waddliaceae bacterium]|nr:SAM-dependent methyltransferase [Waddliaceae bacterium]